MDPQSPESGNAPSLAPDALAQWMAGHRQRFDALCRAEEAALDEAASKFTQTLEENWQKIEREQERLSAWQTTLAERQAELEARRDELEQRGRDLEACRAEWEKQQLAAAEQQQETLARIQRQLDQLDARRRELEEAQAAASRHSDSNTPDPRLKELQEECASLRAERDALQQEHEALRAEAQRWKEQFEEASARLGPLQEELAELQSRLDESGGDAASDPNEWQQRYELAMQDVQELKEQNQELRRRLEEVSQKTPAITASPSDWSALKQKLLAQLEAEPEEEASTPERAQERLSIEGTIRITDEIVAKKDAEIAELRQLLEAQAGQVGDVVVGAAALGDIIDQDELIQQEREKLESLQQEWREKLRAAELEIATERAALARERSQMEEQMQQLERLRKELEELGAPETTSDRKTPPKRRRRWFSRLGIDPEDAD